MQARASSHIDLAVPGCIEHKAEVLAKVPERFMCAASSMASGHSAVDLKKRCGFKSPTVTYVSCKLGAAPVCSGLHTSHH